uniref:LRAT domain-containing protein n=1 Tax=Strongyloides papillosus TaxID=174720 RepID=A0A0N5BI13_STREA
MNDGIITPWTSAEELVGKLEIGDLIQIRRRGKIGIPIYKHWAVYIGFKNGIHEVVHFSNGKNTNIRLISLGNLFSSDSICDGRRSSIRIDSLSNVCASNKCRINNSMDKKCKPLPAMHIYYRVISRLVSYGHCVCIYNCEDLAKWARYDLSCSGQVNIKKCIVIGVGTLLISKSLLIALAAAGIEYLLLEVYETRR